MASFNLRVTLILYDVEFILREQCVSCIVYAFCMPFACVLYVHCTHF